MLIWTLFILKLKTQIYIDLNLDTKEVKNNKILFF